MNFLNRTAFCNNTKMTGKTIYQNSIYMFIFSFLTICHTKKNNNLPMVTTLTAFLI